MSMKILFSYLVILFLVMTPAFAQKQAKSPDAIIAQMQSTLNLTPDQVNAVTPIIQKYFSKRQQIKQDYKDGTIEKSDMRAQMKQTKEDEGGELSQVLSAAQMSQWEQMMSQHRHKENGGGNGSDGEAGPPGPGGNGQGTPPGGANGAGGPPSGDAGE